MCTVTGPQDKVQQAANMINELIDTAMVSHVSDYFVYLNLT